MKHQPSYSDITVSKTVHQRIEFIQNELFCHNTFNQKVFTPLVAIILFVHKLLDVVFNTLQVENISESHLSSSIWVPPKCQIYDVSEIIGNHPVVVKVLVYNLSHRTFRLDEDLWDEEQENK